MSVKYFVKAIFIDKAIYTPPSREQVGRGRIVTRLDTQLPQSCARGQEQ